MSRNEGLETTRNAEPPLEPPPPKLTLNSPFGATAPYSGMDFQSRVALVLQTSTGVFCAWERQSKATAAASSRSSECPRSLHARCREEVRSQIGPGPSSEANGVCPAGPSCKFRLPRSVRPVSTVTGDTAVGPVSAELAEGAAGANAGINKTGLECQFRCQPHRLAVSAPTVFLGALPRLPASSYVTRPGWCGRAADLD